MSLHLQRDLPQLFWDSASKSTTQCANTIQPAVGIKGLWQHYGGSICHFGQLSFPCDPALVPRPVPKKHFFKQWMSQAGPAGCAPSAAISMSLSEAPDTVLRRWTECWPRNLHLPQ